MQAANNNTILNSPAFHIAVFSFLLNFIWELLQLPLFVVADDFPYYEAILHCTQATFGDVLISLAAYYGASMFTQSRYWMLSYDKAGVVVFLSIGMIITVVFELLATGPLDRWQYGELMPIIPVINVGLSPVVQWLFLPLLQLWFVRRQIIGGGLTNEK